VPYTPSQRRLFHAMAEDADVAREHGTSRKKARKLAEEADELAREDKEKKEKSAGYIDLSAIFRPNG
jgi:hemerythrin-like domain-containing protein